jgi:hypothetical protein
MRKHQEVLVDDCLSTETIKMFIDSRLDRLDEIRYPPIQKCVQTRGGLEGCEARRKCANDICADFSSTSHSREEQMDMLTDKYKKVESDPAAASNPQAGEMMAFVSVEEPVVEDLSDGQRLLLPSSVCLWVCHRLPFSQSVCANA